jgi:hypothetical protein
MTSLDFSILNVSTKSMLFIDESDYNSTPSLPLLEVKFPSISTIYSCYIRPKEVNCINTQTLCYSNTLIDFPDGLYEITYSIEPQNFKFVTKKVMRLEKAKEKIKELLNTEDCTKLDKETINKLYKLDMYIQGAESLAQENPDKALEYFNQVIKETKKLNC